MTSARALGKIFIISGPSGSGKTTLYKKLLADPDVSGKLVKSISMTTRPQRHGEEHGRDYIFVTPKMFLYKRKSGHFLESEEVFGNYYGTPKKNVDGMLKSGKNVLLCIDVKGARVVAKKYAKAIKIFIKTSSLDVLKHRLEGRGSEEPAIIELRLKTAQEELKEVSRYDHVVINDDLATAYAQLKFIVLKALAESTVA